MFLKRCSNLALRFSGNQQVHINRFASQHGFFEMSVNCPR